MLGSLHVVEDERIVLHGLVTQYRWPSWTRLTTRRQMSVLLTSIRPAVRVAPPQRRAAAPNPDVVRRLRELGYVADSAPGGTGSAGAD